MRDSSKLEPSSFAVPVRTLLILTGSQNTTVTLISKIGSTSQSVKHSTWDSTSNRGGLTLMWIRPTQSTTGVLSGLCNISGSIPDYNSGGDPLDVHRMLWSNLARTKAKILMNYLRR